MEKSVLRLNRKPILEKCIMPFCPVCRYEYVPGVTRCSDCDVDLVPNLPEAESTHAEEDELQPIFAAAQPTEAMIVKGLLEDNGIQVIDRPNSAFRSSVDPMPLGQYGGRVLMVRASQLNAARKILEQSTNAVPEADPPVTGEDELVPAFSTADSTEAITVERLLEENGIPVTHKSDTHKSHSKRVTAAHSEDRILLVSASQLDAARRIVKETQAVRTTSLTSNQEKHLSKASDNEVKTYRTTAMNMITKGGIAFIVGLYTFVTLLFAGMGYGVMVDSNNREVAFFFYGMALACMIPVLWMVWTRAIRYEVNDSGVHIVRLQPFKSIHIPFSAMHRVAHLHPRIDHSLQNAIVAMPHRGVPAPQTVVDVPADMWLDPAEKPAYLIEGLLRLRIPYRYQVKLFSYVTNMNCVVLITGAMNYAISPENPDAFVKDIRKKAGSVNL
jgi:hypothetical protein